MNVVLIGYRASGKTTVGRLLADRLWLDFVDTDVLVQRRAGATIREIFQAQGEAHFRGLEAEVIKEVASIDKQVIAAGGGAVLAAENMNALKKNGRVIWLQATAEALWDRMRADPATADARPNLTGAGGLEEIKTLLVAREAAYRAAADATLDVTRLDPDRVVGYLMQLI